MRNKRPQSGGTAIGHDSASTETAGFSDFADTVVVDPTAEPTIDELLTGWEDGGTGAFECVSECGSEDAGGETDLLSPELLFPVLDPDADSRD